MGFLGIGKGSKLQKIGKGDCSSLAGVERTIEEASRALRDIIYPVDTSTRDPITQVICNQQAWEDIGLIGQVHLLANDYQSKSAEIEEERRQHAETAATLKETQASRDYLSYLINEKEKEHGRKSRKELDDHSHALTLLQNKHGENVAQMEKEHKYQMRMMSIALDKVKEDMGIEREKFQIEMQRLHDKHQKEQEDAEAARTRLKHEIRTRNKALLAREKTTAMADGELKSTFLDLLHNVDTIARLEWTSNRSNWTMELQDKLSDNPRRLQRQILLDTIWGILFQNVFCSPYRLLGDAGHKLESQWQQDFGKNYPKSTAKGSGETYIWPQPPTFESERWRYETIQQALQAVEKPLSEYSKRQELRQGYEQSLERTQDELRQALEKVASLDENTIQLIQKICGKASKLWLAFGTQRCRLCIMIRGLNTTTESSKESGSGDRFLEFVLRPQLQRYGDSLGELFDNEATISGCEGESIKIIY